MAFLIDKTMQNKQISQTNKRQALNNKLPPWENTNTCFVAGFNMFVTQDMTVF